VRRCAECAGRRLGFTTARAAIVYDTRAKAVVNAWKEHGRRDLARVAATIVSATLPRPSADLLTFVPSDPGRLLMRGHGPAERLAREIGRLWGIRTRTLLIRTRSVSRQRGLSLADRRRNVRGAFTTAAAIRGRVVLVDDVYTTGATASACATALRRAGATDVEVICLARAIR
jgi:ComF family protein